MKIKLPPRKKGPAPMRPPRLKLKASVARSRRAPVIEEDDDDLYDEPEPNMKLSHAFVVVLVLHVIAVAGVFAFNTIKARQDQVFAAADAKAAAPQAAEAEVAPAAAPVASAEPRPLTTAPGLPEATAAAPAPAQAPAPRTAEVASAPASPVAGTIHEVKAGETLTRISAQYGVSVAAIQEANGIDDPTKIRVGTQLTIPKAGESAPAPVAKTNAPAETKPAAPAAEPKTSAPAAASAVTDSGKVYEVVKGDNPVTIAKKFNVSYDALMELNGITDPRKLQIGQKLKIPAGN